MLEKLKKFKDWFHLKRVSIKIKIVALCSIYI